LKKSVFEWKAAAHGGAVAEVDDGLGSGDEDGRFRRILLKKSVFDGIGESSGGQ